MDVGWTYFKLTIFGEKSFTFFKKEDYKKEILGENTFKISIEASTESGWKKVVGKNGVTLGMSTYGKSGPYKEVYKLFNLTSDEVVKIVKENVLR